MSGKINVILGVYDHLPNGAAEEEFENLYNVKIRPLVSALYQFPAISMVFHYSGVLFHWMERRHPELLVLIEDLLSRKQVELLGGGFYDPMMPLLPLTDRIGQIEMLTTYLRRQFGRRPQGCWFPSRAWEQNLVGPLGSCGMNYTFLDESCFSAAGANQPPPLFLYEPCITEDQGKIITVFPVSASLASIKPAAMLEKLRMPENSISLFEGPVTIFPDFTINPGEQAETEYQQFFEELSVADSHIEFTTPGRIYRNLRGLEKLYFTGGPANQVPSPRQFLTRYPEAGNIYAKMIHTRMLINQLRGDKARKQSALEEVWKAQDSTLFSPEGLTNAAVRKAAYRALLEAEKITREKSAFVSSLSVFDYNLDGEDEYVFQSEKLNCYIKTRGAALSELDYLPKSWNCLDTFMPPMSAALRGAFTDCLVPANLWPSSEWPVMGARFCGGENFQAAELDRVKKQAQFRLGPKEGIPLGGIGIKKTWSLKANILSLHYEFENAGSTDEDFFLVLSAAFSFSGGSEDLVRLFTLRANSRETANPGAMNDFSLQDIKGLEFRDVKNEAVLLLEANRLFDARVIAAETAGFEGKQPVYQYTSVFPVLRVSLAAGKKWEAGFTLKINS